VKLTTLAHFLVSLSLALPLLPATIVVNPNPPSFATAINDDITGADLAGLVVSATYALPDGPKTVTLIWAPTGPTSGAASSKVVSLSLAGSTDAPLAWHYSSLFLSNLLSRALDGMSAGIY
jgi:hypothetical protein